MKVLMTVLIASFLSTASFASVTKPIEASVQLYAGTSVDVLVFLEGRLRQEAVLACGTKDSVLGLTDYTVNMGATGAPLLDIDVDSGNFTGPYVSSTAYPHGKATANVVCKK